MKQSSYKFINKLVFLTITISHLPVMLKIMLIKTELDSKRISFLKQPHSEKNHDQLFQNVEKIQIGKYIRSKVD